MTNWQKFKITKIQEEKVFDTINFKLESYNYYWARRIVAGEKIDPLLGSTYTITCENGHHIDNCRVGDYLEVDVDKVIALGEQYRFFDASMVRKFGSSSSTNIVSTRASSDIVVSSSAVNYMKSQEARELAREMSRMVDDNPGKEVEYKIQVENKDGKKLSHSLIMRKQN